MAVSAQSSALRSTPGYVPRPASFAAYAPSYPTLSAIPSVPALDDARAPYGPARASILASLGPGLQMHNAALTNIQASAKLGLAGYGGWGFGTDNPATPEREDLLLNFDPKGALRGERNKADYRQQVNAGNQRGMLYSSLTNQNIAAGQQRLTLEAQQIANQYATAINQEQANYAGNVSKSVGEWTSYYGQDAMWLSDHPPPPAAVPPPASGPGAGAAHGAREWLGSNPPNLKSLAKQWGVPESSIRVTPINNFGQYWAYIPSEMGESTSRYGSVPGGHSGPNW